MSHYDRIRSYIRENNAEALRAYTASADVRCWLKSGGLNTYDGNVSLLHYSADTGRDRMLRELLELRADPNAQRRDHNRETPLHLAVVNRHQACVELLLQHGAKPSSKDSTGSTPLHMVARLVEDEQTFAIAGLLLQHGADVATKDAKERNAIDVASEKKKTRTMRRIQSFHGTAISYEPLPLDGKVKYYVDEWKRVFQLSLPSFHMDKQATYSVTAAAIARYRDLEILQKTHHIPSDATILDGMACVGGDTISFMRHFSSGTVISNEYDHARFAFLRHNVAHVESQLQQNKQDFAHQRCRFGSVLDLWNAGADAADSELFQSCDMLYLDPEWGGMNYSQTSDLSLSIGTVPLDQCLRAAIESPARPRWIVLKLPMNFDRFQLTQLQICTTLYKMSVRGNTKMCFAVLQPNLAFSWKECCCEVEVLGKRRYCDL